MHDTLIEELIFSLRSMGLLILLSVTQRNSDLSLVLPRFSLLDNMLLAFASSSLQYTDSGNIGDAWRYRR